jgi:hypothetical protein
VTGAPADERTAGWVEERIARRPNVVTPAQGGPFGSVTRAYRRALPVTPCSHATRVVGSTGDR